MDFLSEKKAFELAMQDSIGPYHWDKTTQTYAYKATQRSFEVWLISKALMINDWIDITNHLPTFNQNILFSTANGKITLGVYLDEFTNDFDVHFNSGFYSKDGSIFFNDVTQWFNLSLIQSD